MRKRKKIDSSTIVLSSIIVVFTIIIFLSLPVLFNYKSMQNEIENKFFSDFKINLKILDIKKTFKHIPQNFNSFNSKILVYLGLIAYWGVILIGTFFHIN